MMHAIEKLDLSQQLVLDLEGVRTAPIAPTQEVAIDGRKVFVFDDVFTDSFVESFGLFMLRQDYRPRPSFDNELSAALDANFIQSLPALPEVADALVDRYHPEMTPAPGNQQFSHGYAAAMRFGDSSIVHQDIPCPDCVTLLYYGNLQWTGRWGGETIFYDDDLLAAAAVSPRPGRIVLFNAAVYHRAGVPMRICPTFRYTFSMFYRCPKAPELVAPRPRAVRDVDGGDPQ
jgi:Rps23 Pro-64 3,4-dihydroxylase Tpa1-like proline 4-hydroxylase